MSCKLKASTTYCKSTGCQKQMRQSELIPMFSLEHRRLKELRRVQSSPVDRLSASPGVSEVDGCQG